MARSVTFELPVDTSMFTPVQLHARSVFTIVMSGWARWLREHWVPFPRLVRDHGLGVVIAGLDLEYLRPFTFFDADTLTATVTLRVAARGKLLVLTGVVAPDGDAAVARVEAVLRPVRISDGVVLAATPTDLDTDVLARFAEDEVVPVAPPRLGPTVDELEATHPLVASSSQTFTLHRHLCEAADQWSGIAVPDLTTEVREQVVSVSAADGDGLSAALLRPMQRIAIEFRRPAFFLDEITVECRAFRGAQGPVFLHRLSSALDGDALATVLEWFTPWDDEARDGSSHHFEQGARR